MCVIGEEDTCVSYEEEDTCVSYEEEDTHVSLMTLQHVFRVTQNLNSLHTQTHARARAHTHTHTAEIRVA
jgi:hypothetical protein